MADSTRFGQSLAGLLEVETADAFDWDTSALADWPNIAPTPAPSSSADLMAASFDRVR